MADTKPPIQRIAEKIQATERFAQDNGGKLYRYCAGAYRRRAEEYVKTQVKKICLAEKMSRQWKSHLANEVVEFIRVDSPELWERPPVDVLNVRNGLLRLCDRKLLAHTPQYLSTVQLPVTYDPDATCPVIDQFVADVFPPDARVLAWEMAGWLAVRRTSIQRAVLLTGEGANGKSTWLNLLVNFLGRPNTSAVSLHKLESDPFAAARLIGKLANICPDLPSAHLDGTSVFKAIVGGDALTAEYKFRDSFDFTPFCGLVFSANHPPRSADSSHAFFRRWVVIPFSASFDGDNEIPRELLDAQLSAPGELSGLLNRALEALPNLVSANGFSQSASVQAALQEFRETTDPLAVWLDGHTIDDPDTYVARGVLRAAYNGDANQHGRPTLSQQTWGRALRKLKPTLELVQRTVNGRVQWCYRGIGLADLANSEATQEELF